ncbi:MAG: LysR family transcriptional regulator, partial [Pseudomonadales bacterium]
MTAMPSLKQMNGLLAVARLGSFSRASVELGVSQSALSQSIQQMEFLLDVQLLERRHRSVTM